MTITELEAQIEQSNLRQAEVYEQIASERLREAQRCREKAEEEAKTARLGTRRAQNALRPSICLGARIERVEAGWAARLDDVWAFGSTPEEAFDNFDLIWIKGDNDDGDKSNREPGSPPRDGQPGRHAVRVD